MRVSAKELPPCGIYRTKTAIAGVEANRLVYFHNHGDPGPGVYYPEAWNQNKAKWSERGQTCPPDFDASASLETLALEGFYRVTKEFHCCEKLCTKFEPDVFVQLGYNGNAQAILFVPELTKNGIQLPQRGTIIDDKNLKHLILVRVGQREETGEPAQGGGGSGGPEIRFPRGGFTLH